MADTMLQFPASWQQDNLTMSGEWRSASADSFATPMAGDVGLGAPIVPTAGAALKVTAMQYAILAVVCTPFILAMKPTSTLRRVLYPAPLLLFLKAFMTTNPIAAVDWGAGYGFGLLLCIWCTKIADRMYFNEPESFKRNGIDDAPGKGPETLSYFQKLLWATELISVTRGVGWNWQVPNLPPQDKLSRSEFLKERAKKAALIWLGLHGVIASSKAMLSLAEAVDNGDISPAFWQKVVLHPFFLQHYIHPCWAFVVYSSLSLPDNLLALFFVGTGIFPRWAEPAAWPNQFGSLATATTFKAGWSKWWHQSLRRPTGSLGAFMVRQIPYLKDAKTPAARTTRRRVMLISTFFVSALLHMGGSIYMSLEEGRFNEGGNMMFFVGSGFVVIGEQLMWKYVLGVTNPEGPTEEQRPWWYYTIGLPAGHSFLAYMVTHHKVMPMSNDLGIVAPGHPVTRGLVMLGKGASTILRNPMNSLIGNVAG